MQRILISILFYVSFSNLFAQKPEKIELLNADVSEFDEALNANATRLLGNVIFRHQDATMYCDSAYLYRNENRLEAFNNIRIKQGDSLNLTGKRLLYSGDTKVANVFDDVVMTDGKMTLNTSRLDYDMTADISSMVKISSPASSVTFTAILTISISEKMCCWSIQSTP
jgi:lipopolysaccharide assembly outer membrane protein LptD (OstA)